MIVSFVHHPPLTYGQYLSAVKSFPFYANNLLFDEILIEIICNLNYSCPWGWDPAFIIKSPLKYRKKNDFTMKKMVLLSFSYAIFNDGIFNFGVESTVKPVLSGHPRDHAWCPLNRGCPLEVDVHRKIQF